MDNNIPESVRKKVIIKELVKGQEAATKLKILLQNENPYGADHLAANVLRSFTEALSIISQPNSSCDDFLNLIKSADSISESRKKGRRGCYKRRKSAAEIWTIVSQTIVDNHSWRKYGQKKIMDSEFPRSYFRCSHKDDQGCSATKQVQKTHDNPDMYQTTYIGIHTCNATPKASTSNEAIFVNSDAEVTPTPSLTIKQEYLKEETPSNVMECDNNADDMLVFQNLALEFGDIEFNFDEN